MRGGSGRNRGGGFLEAIIENEGGCKKEIPQRVTLGRVATQALRKTWKNKRMSKLTKNEN